MWTASVGCDPGSICRPGTQSRPSPGTGRLAACSTHCKEADQALGLPLSPAEREQAGLELGEPLSGTPWDLGRDGASSRCRRVLRVIPGPGVEGMRTELPTGGGLAAVCRYLHKEGSQSGQGNPRARLLWETAGRVLVPEASWIRRPGITGEAF